MKTFSTWKTSIRKERSSNEVRVWMILRRLEIRFNVTCVIGKNLNCYFLLVAQLVDCTARANRSKWNWFWTSIHKFIRSIWVSLVESFHLFCRKPFIIWFNVQISNRLSYGRYTHARAHTRLGDRQVAANRGSKQKAASDIIRWQLWMATWPLIQRFSLIGRLFSLLSTKTLLFLSFRRFVPANTC